MNKNYLTIFLLCLISTYAATQDRKLNHLNLLKDKIFHLKKFLKKDEYFSLVKLLNSKEINKYVSNLLLFNYDKLHSICNSYKENRSKRTNNNTRKEEKNLRRKEREKDKDERRQGRKKRMGKNCLHLPAGAGPSFGGKNSLSQS